MDQIDGIIVGASIAAIVTVLVTKWFDHGPIGGGTPAQAAEYSANARGHALMPMNVCPLPPGAAPLSQNTPITEAAYNQGMVAYVPAFGQHENQPDDQNAEVLTV